MFRQYIKFLANGVVLGLVALVLQNGLFRLFGGETGLAYALAVALTYAPLTTANFLVQRALIFRAEGRFLRFVIANVLIAALVSALSPLCRSAIAGIFGPSVGDGLGFLVAALLGATPSFLLVRNWVFVVRRAGVVS